MKVAGRYRVDEPIASSGEIRVVPAYDDLFEQRVALAIVPAQEACGRFVEEACALARVASPHVSRVYDVGELPDGRVLVAMEEVEGEDLADVLAATGPLPVETAVDYALQMLEALAFAHVEGILHRELTPRAVVLALAENGHPTIKVVDFQVSGEPRPRTAESLRYAAPEQVLHDRAVDERADLYAAGAILYELLAGVPPIEGPTVEEITRRVVLDSPPTVLRQLRADVPARLADAVLRCLAKEPSARFETAGDLAPALAPFGSGRYATCVARAQIVLGRLPGTRGVSSRPPPDAIESAVWPIRGRSRARSA